MYQFVSIEKLACLRKRLAIEADSAIKTTLTHLLEKEIERCAIAIQKEIDRRDASWRPYPVQSSFRRVRRRPKEIVS